MVRTLHTGAAPHFCLKIRFFKLVHLNFRAKNQIEYPLIQNFGREKSNISLILLEQKMIICPSMVCM